MTSWLGILFPNLSDLTCHTRGSAGPTCSRGLTLICPSELSRNVRGHLKHAFDHMRRMNVWILESSKILKIFSRSRKANLKKKKDLEGPAIVSTKPCQGMHQHGTARLFRLNRVDHCRSGIAERLKAASAVAALTCCVKSCKAVLLDSEMKDAAMPRAKM